jgi:2-succinyl-5-enolpyruvyl-6-hydroxy-3-cyclohexene-1-carboxylate synthase
MMETGELNLLWAQLIVEELRRQGVQYFCLAPGSRSSPLAVAVAQDLRLQRIVHLDERGLAFHALGYARGAGKAAAIVCTSGTAAANFLPAVVEAFVDGLPMIVLTADRPPELRQCGANQTIDQVKLYGGYTRFASDLPCPDPDIDPAYVLSTVDQAVQEAIGLPPGPVHLNCMYRKPLVPERLPEKPYDVRIEAWCEGHHPWTNVAPVVSSPDSRMLGEVSEHIRKARHGVIIAGRTQDVENQAAKELSTRLKWPLLPDICVPWRFAGGDTTINYHSLALASAAFRDSVKPDVIIHLGGPVVSKSLNEFIAENREAYYITVNPAGLWSDPTRTSNAHFACYPTAFTAALPDDITVADSAAYLRRWQQASEKVGTILKDVCRRTEPLTELSLVCAMSEAHAETGLFLASSLPVRDMDWFAASTSARHVAANRGASGIDGTIASAAGYAAGLDKGVTVLIGDLAALHDLNAFALVAKNSSPLTVVIVNNRGGRIFEQLPVANHADLLEEYFVVKHRYKFKGVAKMFGLDYVRADSIESLTGALEHPGADAGPRIVEAVIDPEAGRTVRQHAFKLIKQKLKGG